MPGAFFEFIDAHRDVTAACYNTSPPVKFSFKVFLAIFGVAAVILAVTSFSILKFVSSHAEAEYIQRYESFSHQAADTLAQIDHATDLVVLNALYALREWERIRGLPSNEELMQFKKDLGGIDSLYVIDRDGKYLRSDWFLTVAKTPLLKARYGANPLPQPLFSFCKDYRNLVAGKMNIAKTPIVPSGYQKLPYKFIMIPNFARSRILESDMSMKFVIDSLDKAREPDPSVLSIGVFTPTGDPLGQVGAGKSSAFAPRLDPAEVDLKAPRVVDGSLIFFTRVDTESGDCCECRNRGISGPDGRYYYVLRVEVSRAGLDAQLAGIRGWFIKLGLLALALSALAAFFVSRRLVQRLTWMSEQVEKASRANDTSLRLDLKGGDEVSVLAGRFDHMMERLEQNRESLAAAEREKALVEVARQVAHDIRSPLAALDAVLKDISNLPEEYRVVVRGAAGRIRDIANDLLGKRRDS